MNIKITKHIKTDTEIVKNKNYVLTKLSGYAIIHMYRREKAKALTLAEYIHTAGKYKYQQ